jgi:type II secretory pathway component PulC
MNGRFSITFLRSMALAAWLIAGLLGVLLVRQLLSPSVSPLGNESEPEVVEIESSPMRQPPPSTVWTTILQAGSAEVAVAPDTPSARYRLAGTFFVQNNPQSPATRSAILDDVSSDAQHWVREGDALDDLDVVRIYRDRVLVRDNRGEYTIRLSFADVMTPSGNEVAASSSETPEALETTEFGRRIGTNRWVMSKEALTEFYQSLMDDPERIAGIYMSMRSVRGGDENDVIGYRIEPPENEDFFTAVGLRPGDQIRKVNSMNMTSQARGEYFLSEFMKDRLGAVVLDIVRDGSEQKLIYLMR